MKHRWILMLVVLATVVLVVAACSQSGPTQPAQKVEVTRVVTQEVAVTREVTRVVQVTVPPKPCPPTPTPVVPYADQVPDLLANSLHGTSRGMKYFYEAAQGGFENITHIPYDQLGCKRCHVESDEDHCNTCHMRDVGDNPPSTTCYKCHGRQKAGLLALHEKDVHLTGIPGGFTCATCHDADEVHGDGKMYNSLQEGIIKVKCVDCHTDKKLPKKNIAHKAHWEDVDCAACHMANTLVCYNCHFETEVTKHKKVAIGKFNQWKFLGMGEDGKVHAATVMPIIYKGQTFVALAPYFDHSIRKPDINTICQECHMSPIITEYNETGKMTVTKWDEKTGKMTYYHGVIPIPPDYKEAMQFDFATIAGWTDDGKPMWKFAKTGVDLWQMLYLKPLEADEMPEPLPGMAPLPTPTPGK